MKPAIAIVLELYGTATCPFTADLREELDWQGRAYLEFDVDADPEALARVRALTTGALAVPVLVESGRVLQIGYHGRSCYVSPG